MENQQIAIIGTGSMGEAILSGLVKAGIKPGNIRATTKTSDTAASLSSKYQVSATNLTDEKSANPLAVDGADIVLLAVKPNLILEILGEISSNLKSGSMVISVAAGITTQAMETLVANTVAVVRAMPNTPSVLGLGLTGISRGSQVSDQQLSQASKLFETVGKVLVVPEDKIDALSTISGSGPAYVFYFAEKLITAAKNLGFTQQEAELMVKETFLGSATLFANSNLSAQELRSQVSSPNGTTMQATAVFDQANLEKIFSEATQAALARAIELGRI
jgi:pyrroline-5-carboxylate reductase